MTALNECPAWFPMFVGRTPCSLVGVPRSLSLCSPSYRDAFLQVAPGTRIGSSPPGGTFLHSLIMNKKIQLPLVSVRGAREGSEQSKSIIKYVISNLKIF